MFQLSNVSAAETQTLFTGKIETDSAGKSIDLTNIDIDIYQSIPRDATATEWITEYDETFAFTVSPNQDGFFEFIPPSPVFSLTVRTDTLPVGFGIDRHTELYYGTNNNENVFTVSHIDEVQLVASSLNEYPEVVILNNSGNIVYTDFKFTPTYTQNLFNPDLVDISGTVKLNGGLEFYPSTTIDLSNTNQFDKLNQLYNVGILTETDYFNASLQAMDNNSQPFCGIPSVDDIASYSIANIPQEVQDSISSLSSEVHNNHFKVHYNANNTTKEKATAVADFLLDMRSKSIGAGFKAPISDMGDSQLNVYLFSGYCTDPHFGTGTRGVTYPTGSGSSIITIWKFSTLDSQEKETVAHEYFHTVQYAYQTGRTPQWFVEACAVWFAARYSGSIKRATSHFNNYFKNCRNSIYTPSLQYGAGVFPMAIDVAYGGPTTIRNIYTRLGSIKPTSETSLEDCITFGIRQYDKSGSFAEAFKKLGAYITLPGHFFKNTIPKGTSWENDHMVQASPSLTSSSKSTLLNSYGLQPFSFEANRNDATFLSIVVGFNSNTKGNASVRVVTKTSSNSIAPFGGDVPSNRYSTLIKFFANTPSSGSNNILSAYVSPMYTGPNSCPVTITYSLSSTITS